jgi:hypothetical protein
MKILLAILIVNLLVGCSTLGREGPMEGGAWICVDVSGQRKCRLESPLPSLNEDKTHVSNSD